MTQLPRAIASSPLMACRIVSTFSFFFLLSTGCQAYVTAPSALPVHRQVAFLKEMTVNLVQTQTPLSNTQLSQAPQLLAAWSKIPTTINHHHHIKNNKPHHHNNDADDAAVACEQLVARIVQDHVAGNRRAVLTVEDYNCLLTTWLRHHRDAATAAERCEQIVQAMQQQQTVKPDLTSFRLLLTAWRHVPPDPSYAPHRASRILEWMMRLYESGENPQAWPDTDCFDTVLTIWSRSGHPEAPEQTEALLGAMERLHQSGHTTIQPGHVSFNAVLSAWAKSHRPEAADRAMKILSFMELLAQEHPESGVKPDAASYNTVMGAILSPANHHHKNTTAVHAQAVLKHALQAYARDGVEPETILFNSVIGALSKQRGQFHRARSVLDRQLKLYHQDGCSSCPPDVVGYTSVIAACAAEPVHKKQAMEVALQTWAEISRSSDKNNNLVRPNHITYATLFKACARLLPVHSPTRRNLVRQVFQQAIEDGCVGDVTLHHLREAAPADLYKELLQGHGKRHLPAAWTRRVATKAKRRAEV